MRTVKVKTDTSSKVSKIQSDAKNFGELKDQLSNFGINWENSTAIVLETKKTLSLKSDSLPEGDFTLFVFPKKSKAGCKLTLSVQDVTIKMKDADWEDEICIEEGTIEIDGEYVEIVTSEDILNKEYENLKNQLA